MSPASARDRPWPRRGSHSLARRERTGVGAAQIATLYAGLGDFDQAFAWLDKAVDDLSIGYGIMGPTFDDLRSDPRFERLRKRLGLQEG